MQTYREAIQIQIRAMMEIYDNAGGLRDVASDEIEKDVYNTIRRDMPKLWAGLQQLDNRLSKTAAAYELKGNYSVKVTKEDV
jgi:hypothetical protein